MNMSAKILIDINSLINYKSRDLIPFECEYCKSTFYKTKNLVQRWLKNTHAIGCCSVKCKNELRIIKINCQCKQCNKKFERVPSEINKNTFCSQTCSAIYNNNHKTTGTRRSKLEKWIEEQLTIIYPTLEIHYNKTTAIDAELDIYIPSLKLAFELNGIFHYEPIYGEEKLNSIQTNDTRKFQACLERKIELCIIDTYNTKYLKKERDKKFLDIITNLIGKTGSPFRNRTELSGLQNPCITSYA